MEQEELIIYIAELEEALKKANIKRRIKMTPCCKCGGIAFVELPEGLYCQFCHWALRGHGAWIEFMPDKEVKQWQERIRNADSSKGGKK